MTKETNANGQMDRCYYNICQQDNTADVYIYGDIVAHPYPPDGDVSAYNLAQKIADLDVDTINVCINSNGGSVSEGLAIYSALCRHPAKIITHCDGFACSVASVVFMAGDERLMSDVGLLMIHEASIWANGNPAELQKAAKTLAIITNAAAEAYKSRVNISDEELAQMLAAETWLTPEEAVKMGFATGIEHTGKNRSADMSAQGQIVALVRRGLAASGFMSKSNDTGPVLIASVIEEMLEIKNDIKSLLAEMNENLVFTVEPKDRKASAGGFFKFK